MISRQMVFLVVDDVEPMRKVTMRQLESLGAEEILTAGNGAEALGILQRQKVDVILCDWNMPVMNGLELLKAVRTDEKLRAIPFVLVTAEAHRERVAEAIACGVSDLLVKPYNLTSLSARIEKAMSRVPRLPRAAAQREAPAKPAPAAGQKKAVRPTLLAVDDTPDNLQVLSHIFKDSYRVRTALDGQKALEICCSDQPPDLVLLDVMMPGMDGFTVLEKMRQHPNAENIPVIFVTAMDGNEARIRGLQLGAVDFVTKPIEPELVKIRVRNFMRYVELHHQLQAEFDGMLEAERLREDVEQITRHDMTGPLSGIVSMARLMADDQGLGANQVDNLRMIESTALQVLDMVNRSSELFKIETGRFDLNAQAVDIGEILRRIAGMAETTFAGKGISIAFDVGEREGGEAPLAQADPMLCHTIFQNLVMNACEAAPSRSCIAIGLSVADEVIAVVKNKGVVPPEIRERFFDKFVTQGKRGGSGLGTYSAKVLTEVQGGTIRMDTSDADNETVISVSLPRFSP